MPSSSLFLRSSATFVSALSLFAVSSAQSFSQYYALDTKYEGSSFFDGFTFFSGADPTHGFVDYISRSDAEAAGLISYGANQPAIMEADAKTSLTPPASIDDYYNQDGKGRKSIRIESIKRWTHGLIILDATHMPTTSTGGCGATLADQFMPAFWTLGSGTWPTHGEIDIVEGANDQVNNFAAGHTGSEDKTRQCTISNAGGTGDLIYSNCNLYTTDPFGNPTNPTGCKIEDKTAGSYGKPFNDNNGSVYAMLWTSTSIKTYFFPRGSVPRDISQDKPDPTKWPAPFGVFSTPCDVESNYQDMQIIFDLTFCGDFGDATWATTCAARTGFDTCAKYVASKPGDFQEAYWEVDSLKVYQLKDRPTTSTTTSSTSSTTSSWSTRSSTGSWTGSSMWSTSSSWTSSWTSSATRPTTTAAATTSSYWTSSSSSYSPTTSSYSPAGSTTRSTTSSWYTSSTSSYSTSTIPSYTRTTTSSSSASPITLTTSKYSTSSSGSASYTDTSTWLDWSVDPTARTMTTSSKPAETTASATTTSYNYDPSVWSDWSSSSSTTTPAKASVTTERAASFEYDPAHTWADWTTSTSSSPAVVTSTSSYADPGHPWSDWSSSKSASSPLSSAYNPGAGGQYYPVSPSETPADMTQAAAESAAAPDATWTSANGAGSGYPAAASGTGSSPGYGSAGQGSPVSPDVAAYTGAAGKASMTFYNILCVAVIAILGVSML